MTGPIVSGARLANPKPYKACSCRDQETKQLLGKKCPKLESSDHGRWYARYERRAASGKRHQPRIGPFRTEAECVAELEWLLSAGPTVNEILDAYMDHLDCADRTRDNYVGALRYVRDLTGENQAQSVTGDDIDFITNYLLTYGKKDGTGLSKRTVDLGICLLRAAYEYAVFEKRLTRRTIPVRPDPGVVAV